MRAWYSGGVASCSAVITATHWTPLPAPPTTDIAHATQQRAAPATCRGRRARRAALEITISAEPGRGS